MRGLARIVGVGLAAALLLFLVLPPAALVASLERDDFARAVEGGLFTALRLSVLSTLASSVLIVVGGTPLAWWLGRNRSFVSRAAEAFVRLPAVTPPAVAGIALLAAFGHSGVAAGVLEGMGIRIPFTVVAVVLAQLFVATPYYVLPLADAFAQLDDETLLAARSLGAHPAKVFMRVSVPLCRPALLSGLAVAWARSLGEFGATIVFAGNLAGRTQTLPTAIYVAMESDLGASRAMAAVLLAMALVLFVALRSDAMNRVFGGRS